MDQVEITVASVEDREVIETHVMTVSDLWGQVGEEPLGESGFRFGDIARLETLVKFLRWEDNGLEEMEKELLTTCLGYAFGEVLSTELGLEWCKLAGAVESLALRKDAKATDVVMPVEMVVQQFHDGADDFLRPLFATVKNGQPGVQVAEAE